MSHNKIWVTGMGCVCAAGSSCAAAWQALCLGTSQRSSAALLDKKAMPFPFFAAPEQVFGSGGRRHSAQDTVQLARHAAHEALAQAGFMQRSACRLGVVIGTTAGSALHFLEGYAATREQRSCALPDCEDYFAANLALVLGAALHATGPVLTIANACTSGTDALGLGADLIKQGLCDAVLCGGADALSLVPHTGFARLMIYSDQPCRPFDKERTGLNLGEGAGMLLLESAHNVHKHKVPVLGALAGYGCAADAYHFTAPHPEGRGLAQAVNIALQEAGIDQTELAFINAHGTATQENDRVEGNYFRQQCPAVPLWASKGVTGHTLGAAGALEAIFCLLALQHQTVPPSFGFSMPDPAIGISPTSKPLLLQKNYALSTSLGFGGGNAALIIEGTKHECA